MEKNCFVYAIGDIADIQTLNLDNCYVGVSVNLKRRWNQHRSAKTIVGACIRALGWCIEENMIILYRASKTDCFEYEHSLRPSENIGLNVAIGGYGGYTSYTEDRNRKISIAKTGVPKSPEMIEKMRQTKMRNGTHTGSRNIKAQKWQLMSPCGKIYHLHGNLEETCKKLNLTVTTLRKHNGIAIPPISVKTRGSVEIIERRNNTTGWSLTLMGD